MLSKINAQYLCTEGHSYDIAKQGYIHLLPVQYKRSRNPGDSKEMVAARQSFLNHGLYQPIADTLNESVLLHTQNHKEICVFEAGCGEGYYLYHILEFIRNINIPTRVSLIGMDISKWAIVTATKRSKEICWVVGSNKHPPILPQSVDLIVCGFGYPDYAAFKKILKPGGKIILLDPGERHLLELRELIYPVVNRKSIPDINAAEKLGFRLDEEKTVTYQTNPLSNSDMQNLMLMTPHLYRAPWQGKKVVEKLDTLSVTVNVSIRILAS